MLSYQEFLEAQKIASNKQWLAQFEAGTIPSHYINKKDIYAYAIYYKADILNTNLTQSELAKLLSIAQSQLNQLMVILALEPELPARTIAQLDKYWIDAKTNSLIYSSDWKENDNN